MAKAKVSVAFVEKFNNAVEKEQTSAGALKSALESVTKIVADIDKELSKISVADQKCKNASQQAAEKRKTLESRLKDLQAKKANTSPTVTVKHYVGDDEDGNPVYREEKKPNPQYQALENEIAICKSKIAKIKEIEGQIKKSIQDLAKAKQTHESAKKHFIEYKRELVEIASTISKKSTSASSQLKKAIAAIRRYMEEYVRISPAPSHTSVAWETSYSPTYMEYYYDRGVDDLLAEEIGDTDDVDTHVITHSTYTPPIAPAPPSYESISSVSQWIKEINPNYYNTDIPNQRQYQVNCGSCALAVYNRLNGFDRDACAGNVNIPTDAEMERATGKTCRYMSVDEITRKLKEAGPGSNFIAGINRKPIQIGNKIIPQSGHWFNVYYDGKQIYTVEGQTGNVYSWPHDYGNISEWCILE